MLVGLGAGLWLLPHPRTIGNVTLDVHTLLYAMVAVLIGFQAVAFAVFTKVYAITEGLLPKDPGLDRLFKMITLEAGLTVGAALIVTGLAGSLYAVHVWSFGHFGSLNASVVLRTVLPSVLALTLGCQVLLSSFFLSVLGLARD
jgi:hypothetical protein